MKTIAVIGCGGIGMRHVEALGAMTTPAHVYAVDPRPEAAQRAAALFEASRSAAGGHGTCEASDAIAKLPANLDLAILATTAQIRLACLEELLRSRTVGAIVLEKYLFTKISDYPRAHELLDARLDSVWVNCSRRMYPGYREIAAQLAGARYIDVRASGRAATAPVGTIAIHFVDLLAMLAADPKIELDVRTERIALMPTRRGLDDFSGIVTARSSDGRYQLRFAALTDTEANLNVTIESDRGWFVIQEWNQRAFVATPASDGKLVEQAFSVPFQSKLSDLVADSILTTGRCDLTPYTESAALHLALLQPLLNAYRGLGHPDAAAVPFT
jgi:predicted dehydrogenase